VSDPRPETGPPGRSLRYVALGDSYTIGTSVGPGERWPDQLVAALDGDPPALELVANLAVNGYTSADLLWTEVPMLAGLDPEVVSVLIGVNDVVQGVSAAIYGSNVAAILDALGARLPAGRIVTIGIPDYTVTPAGADYGDPRAKHNGIVASNAIMAELSAARGIAYVDVLDLSLAAADDPALVADDWLHPSGAQYWQWVERIAPVVAGLLARDRPTGQRRPDRPP
jgi:lysophospholipase L1-like esterase